MPKPVLQDEITLHPASIPSSSSKISKPVLIFFIPGNPGLIEYYRSFLHHLHSLLPPGNNITIHGSSHLGFEIHSSTPRSVFHAPPFSLHEVIGNVKFRVLEKAREISGDRGGEVDVILIGHSVGAYMLLEVLDRWQREEEEGEGKREETFRIVGGVGLFPTIVDIAQSEKGRALSWLLALPFLPLFLQTIARLLSLIPTTWINWPEFLNPGSQGMDVTEAMIKSQNGVRQTIYMANQEMQEIKEDKWHPSNIWGAIPPLQKDCDDGDITTTTTTIARNKTKLFFYWGKNDYWVNNYSRDSLIASRAGANSGTQPRMYIDPGEIPHTFSLERKDMIVVAEKVREFIAELQMPAR